MSVSTAADHSASQIHLPSHITLLIHSIPKLFCLGAPLFSGVSGTLYPISVLKTRQQVMVNSVSCSKMAASIFKTEGCRGFYRGFGTSLLGTIPARALYMGAFEVTMSNVGSAARTRFGLSEAPAWAIAYAAAGVSASMAAQLVWTPFEVVSQRLMVQGGGCDGGTIGLNKYNGGIDAFRKIMDVDGVRGLYRGYGISIFTCALSNALWWVSYLLAHRTIWDGLGCYLCKKTEDGNGGSGYKPDWKAEMAAQAVSAAVASGVLAVGTTPLDAIKTRLQVTGIEGVRNLLEEGRLSACYRGLGPRWALMSMSSATVITTYEFLRRSRME